MQTNNSYDVVYIGNYTKDTIKSPAGIKYVAGGAVNYAAYAAACLGYHVAVITRLSKEDVRVVNKFLQAGIDCYPTYTPDSTLMKLDYPTLNPDIRELSVAATAGSITAEDVKDIDAKAAVIGSSLREEVGLDVIDALWEKKITVAVDMQGFVRVLRDRPLFYEPWPEMQSALAHVHILKSDAVEAQHLTGETDIYHAARFYAAPGPQEIVLTHKDGPAGVCRRGML